LIDNGKEKLIKCVSRWLKLSSDWEAQNLSESVVKFRFFLSERSDSDWDFALILFVICYSNGISNEYVWSRTDGRVEFGSEMELLRGLATWGRMAFCRMKTIINASMTQRNLKSVIVEWDESRRRRRSFFWNQKDLILQEGCG
jgi:hypothetical protein